MYEALHHKYQNPMYEALHHMYPSPMYEALRHKYNSPVLYYSHVYNEALRHR